VNILIPETKADVLELQKLYDSGRLQVGDSVKPGKVTKGDLEGHPFRGNQWTDGQQSASSEPSLVGAAAKAEAEANEKYQVASAKFFAEMAKADSAVWSEAEALASAKVGHAVAWANLKGLVDSSVARAPIPEIEAWAKLMLDTSQEGHNVGVGNRALAAIAELERTRLIVEANLQAEGMARQSYFEAHPEVGKARLEQVRLGAELDNATHRYKAELRDEKNASGKEVRALQAAAEAKTPRITPALATVPFDKATADAINRGDKLERFSDYLYGKDEKGNGITYTPKPTFEATVKSASDFKAKMADMYSGVEVVGVPRGASMHLLTQIHDEFGALRDEFPEVAVRVIKLNAGGMRATAWGEGGDKITFGKQAIESFARAHVGFGSGKERKSLSEAPDFHDGMRNFASVVRHEFGHQLHFQHPELLERFDSFLKTIPASSRAKITGYALKNRREMFAETVAAIKYGDAVTRSHPAVVELEKIMRDYFANLRKKRKD
jgi:hypothetical protein